MARQRHGVHDVDDVELVDLIWLVARETHEVTGEVVDRLGVATGNEVLDVAPHAHDVRRRCDLLPFGQLTVREKDPGAAPLLEHLGVGVREAEQAERGVTRERERELVHEVDDVLVTEADDEVLGVVAQLRLEGLQATGRHDRQDRLAHRPVAGRVGVVERRDALEPLGEHLLCRRAHRHERRRRVGCRPRLTIRQDRLDVVEARDDVVVEGGHVQHRRLTPQPVQQGIRIEHDRRVERVVVVGHRASGHVCSSITEETWRKYLRS